MPSGVYERKPCLYTSKKCPCGVSFLVPPSRKDTAKYCSQVCHMKYRDYFATNSSKKVPRVSKICLICDKEFLIERWRLRDKGRGKFCSRECGDKRAGKLANNWQGGISANTQKKRVGYLYVSLKRELFKKESSCRMCGASEKLAMDHIIPIAIDPDRIYDITNVQLLCAPCHMIKTRVDMKNIYAVKRLEKSNG